MLAGLPTDPNRAGKGAARWNKLQYKWQEGDGSPPLGVISRRDFECLCIGVCKRKALHINDCVRIWLLDLQDFVREKASRFLSTVHRYLSV
jgi:hypothetical protein